jgi:hypothetical protein
MAKNPEVLKVRGHAFLAAIDYDPDWLAKNKDRIIEVTDPVTFPRKTKGVIPANVHFTSKEKAITIDLTVSKITGFHAYVSGAINAAGSILESTAGLRVMGKDQLGVSASFRACKALKIAEGEFEGAVEYALSSVEKIGAFKVKTAATGFPLQGLKADFFGCPLGYLPQKLSPADFRVSERVAAAHRLKREGNEMFL